jgi:divalent metal cation (Fe/Co/Zn/Cd) transporter
LLNVDIKFRSGLDVEELEAAIDRLENRIRAGETCIKRIFIEAEALKHDGRRPKRAA